MFTLAEESFSDAYLLEAVRDCEGNHLSFPIPPIELLEHMLTHPEKRPIRQLLPPCLGCLGTVHDELRELCSRLLRSPPLSRFPQLQARLREEVETLLDRQRSLAQAKLEELIGMEEAYVYTDDPACAQRAHDLPHASRRDLGLALACFTLPGLRLRRILRAQQSSRPLARCPCALSLRDLGRSCAVLAELQAAVKKLVTRLDAPLLRSILTSYFATATRTLTNAVPKAIMLHMVRATQGAVYGTLFEALAAQSTDGLLDEPMEVDVKRRAEIELLGKLRAAKRALESLA